jgi:hypothetical protein
VHPAPGQALIAAAKAAKPSVRPCRVATGSDGPHPELMPDQCPCGRTAACAVVSRGRMHWVAARTSFGKTTTGHRRHGAVRDEGATPAGSTASGQVGRAMKNAARCRIHAESTSTRKSPRECALLQPWRLRKKTFCHFLAINLRGDVLQTLAIDPLLEMTARQGYSKVRRC